MCGHFRLPKSRTSQEIANAGYVPMENGLQYAAISFRKLIAKTNA
jgi:hypothetical protein